jgi:uncharacterized protein
MEMSLREAVKPGVGAVVPVGADERIEAVDILRGVALFGVMAINVLSEFRVSIFQQFVVSPAPAGELNRWIETFFHLFIELKAMAVFSMLFGLGLAIQFDRLRARGPVGIWLMRRLLALLLIGMVHLLLIWNGDILVHYAVAGLVVLPFLFASKKWTGISAVLVAAFYLAMGFMHLPLPTLNMGWIATHLVKAAVVFRHASYWQTMVFEWSELPQLLPLHVYSLPRTVALFLFGSYCWRSGVVKDLQGKARGLLVTAVVCVGAGVVMVVLTSALGGRWALPSGAVNDVVGSLGDLSLSVGYAAGILFVCTRAWGRVLLGWAAPLGRMAFTNYVMQSVVFSALFYGWGLGLYGMSAAPALAIGTGVYAIQAIGSAAWLRRYRFGPVEWLWRTMMYGRRQPMVGLGV